MKPVIMLGDVNVDMVVHLPDRSGDHVDLTRSVPQVVGGGTGGNTAVALGRLGTPVTFIGSVGDDGYGRLIRDDFAREGVSNAGLRVYPDAFTPMVLAMIEPDGERFLVIWPPQGGAHVWLQPADVDEGLIGNASWLHTTGMCLRASPVKEAILHGMRLARQAGIPVSLDLNLRIELWGYDAEVRATVEEAISLADVVFGNGREEIMPVAGVTTTIEAAAQALSAGSKTIVARMGAEGVFAISPEVKSSAPAFPVTVVNSVGAGDAFDAGFITARLLGLPIVEALRWGNAVAALKIQHPGSRDLPTRAEVEALLAGR